MPYNAPVVVIWEIFVAALIVLLFAYGSPLVIFWAFLLLKVVRQDGWRQLIGQASTVALWWRGSRVKPPRWKPIDDAVPFARSAKEGTSARWREGGCSEYPRTCLGLHDGGGRDCCEGWLLVKLSVVVPCAEAQSDAGLWQGSSNGVRGMIYRVK